MAETNDRGAGLPLPDLTGSSLRALAERVRLPPEDRSALAAALKRMREHDGVVPAVLMYEDNP